MTPTLKYIYSTLLVVCFYWGQAQSDTLQVPKPKKDWRPYDIKIGINLIRPIRTAVDPSFISNEVQTTLSLYKYTIFLDYGIQNTVRNEVFNYENQGNYFRAGVSGNFVENKKSGNIIALGLRYARASFRDQMSYSVDNFFGNQMINLSNPNLDARWLELVFDLRGKVVGNLFIGFSTRWQFARQINGQDLLKTYDIPGFGNTKRTNSTAFDYYIMWRIPFRTKIEN